ncbi:hypothetical protein EYF80_009197 [Liparis tanakae]|uniref:Uncharacterized protein n=1 Tax=Liparis tanakae TaxID=230148 RepID=A0A4Z2IS79_9TELE|nr:hypothetical protein EYF80_009197 [Liparis tanakae]
MCLPLGGGRMEKRDSTLMEFCCRSAAGQRVVRVSQKLCNALLNLHLESMKYILLRQRRVSSPSEEHGGPRAEGRPPHSSIIRGYDGERRKERKEEGMRGGMERIESEWRAKRRGEGNKRGSKERHEDKLQKKEERSLGEWRGSKEKKKGKEMTEERIRKRNEKMKGER